VQCLLAVGKNDRRNNQRLFANNVVQYFGNPYKYEKNLVAGEQYSFAGHVEFSDVVLREMTVYVTLLEGDSLKIGIRTSNMESDGDVSTQKSPMFRIDYFRLTKMASANDVPVTNNTRVNYVVNNRSLTVMGVDSYTLYNVNGVKTADVNNTSETIPELLPGVYIIKTKNAGVLKAIIN
jgi:hypothetical protein